MHLGQQRPITHISLGERKQLQWGLITIALYASAFVSDFEFFLLHEVFVFFCEFF
jgi:hypothetical protein